MTVTTITNNASFAGNDVVTVLPFTFRFFTDADLVVIRIDDVTGAQTALVLSVDYTVTGAGSAAGGSVVLSVALPTGKTVNVSRMLSPVQLVEIINQGKFFPEIHENVFDYLTMLIQQTNSSNDRSMLFPITDPDGTSMTLPNLAARALKALGFNAAGEPAVSTMTMADIEAQVPLAAAQAAAAAASAVSADGFSDLAEKWAENPENVPVVTGPDKFSALHWAAKALASAAAAAASAAVFGLPPAYLAGLAISNNGGAPTTTINVAGGNARNLLNTLDINLAASISGILQTSGSWAAGTGQNKMDAGARAANTTYHVHVIRKTSDGTGDILVSLSPSAPTMPTGYSGFRRIGAVLTDAGNLIKAFVQIGDEFLLASPLADVNAAAVGAGTALYAISVPTGIVVRAIVQGSVQTSAGAAFYHINSPGLNDVAGSLYGTAVTTGVSVAATFGRVYIRTNTSAQIQLSSQLASNTHRLASYGWVDRRDV